MDPTLPRQRCAEFFKTLQNNICAGFEEIDQTHFEHLPWEKEPGEMLQGGGEIRVMRGEIFEKVGVNFSCVHGQFSPQFAKEIPGAAESGGQFWACGVSLVSHMKNPYVPAVHMNVRRIETSKGWFGGGADLTPYEPAPEAVKTFHNHMKKACDSYQTEAYEAYKKNCDDYFFLPHRGEPRGEGGIFFDTLDSGDFEKDFEFVQRVGNEFLEGYSQVVKSLMNTPFGAEEKERQLVKRGRYVEFNLLYDRGTRFGFQTGGNSEAILMSMPPEVRWP